jgi:predicted transcriptional regulator
MVAVPKIKSTYALDPETVQRLEHMARRWGVSKSEVLRRAIRAAASESSEVATDAVSALDELQRSLRVSRAKAQAWAGRSRAERRAAAAHRERNAG